MDADGTASSRWKIEESRSAFLRTTKTPSVSFWKYFFQVVGDDRFINNPRYAPVTDWAPEASNCRELQGSLEWVIEQLPSGAAQAAAPQVFAGRIIDGRATALSVAREYAAYVSVPLQLTNVIGAYASAFRSFTKALREGAHVLNRTLPEDPERDAAMRTLEEDLITGVWDEIASIRHTWRDPSQLSGVPRSMLGPTGGLDDLMRDVVDVERFVLAHELAHLVLGHSELAVTDVPLATTLEVFVEEAGFPLSGIADADRRYELTADAFAFLVLAGAFKEAPNFQALYRASYAGFLALVSVSDVNEGLAHSTSWQSTHPDLVQRQLLLSTLVHHLSKGRRPQDRAHPVLFSSQMESFVTVALQVRAQQGVADTPLVSLTHLVGQMYQGASAFHRKFSDEDPLMVLQEAQATAHLRSALLSSNPDANVQPATEDHWAMRKLDALLEKPAGYCIHLQSHLAQTQFVYAWEGFFRCEACLGQHAAAAAVRADPRVGDISEVQDDTCDRCGSRAHGQFEIAWLRVGIWVVIVGICADCQASYDR